MPTKEQIMKDLDDSGKNNYSVKEVKAIVSSLKKEPQKPETLKKGDIYVTNIGGKKRPVVICNVVGDVVVGIPLSTTEDSLNLMQFNSRFCGENFFTKQVVTSTYEHALENFSGVFDNNAALTKAAKLMKEFYNEVL